jgi:hypothetical protein
MVKINKSITKLIAQRNRGDKLKPDELDLLVDINEYIDAVLENKSLQKLDPPNHVFSIIPTSSNEMNQGTDIRVGKDVDAKRRLPHMPWLKPVKQDRNADLRVGSEILDQHGDFFLGETYSTEDQLPEELKTEVERIDPEEVSDSDKHVRTPIYTQGSPGAPFWESDDLEKGGKGSGRSKKECPPGYHRHEGAEYCHPENQKHREGMKMPKLGAKTAEEDSAMYGPREEPWHEVLGVKRIELGGDNERYQRGNIIYDLIELADGRWMVRTANKKLAFSKDRDARTYIQQQFENHLQKSRVKDTWEGVENKDAEERMGIKKSLDKLRIKRFLKGYEKLALQGLSFSDKELEKLHNLVPEYLRKDTSDRLAKVLNIDRYAHILHQERIYPILDELAAKTKDIETTRGDRLILLQDPSAQEKLVELHGGIEILSKAELRRDFVIAGYASVEVIDKEGHKITVDALREAVPRFMANPQYRNVNVFHSDVQVGVVLPYWKNPENGKVHRTRVNDKGWFVVCKLRDDLEIADKVKDEIIRGNIRSFSIAGNARDKHLVYEDGKSFYKIDLLDLYEVTLCESPVNQESRFEVLYKMRTNKKYKLPKVRR